MTCVAQLVRARKYVAASLLWGLPRKLNLPGFSFWWMSCTILPMTVTPEKFLDVAKQDPQRALDELDKADAADSLLSYIKLMWPILEPGREFIQGWAVEAICEHLEAVTRGDIRKLLINVPPGCMKSLTTNVFWPSWEWGPKGMGHLRYVSASYSPHLTRRDNKKCRQLIDSEHYRRLWGDKVQITSARDAVEKFENNLHGFRLATSSGGVATGERGDRFVIDDPHNVKDGESDLVRNKTLQWFTEVVPTRINDAEKSAFIVIMQRVHEEDVSGAILSEADNLGYTSLILPMEYDTEHPHIDSSKKSPIGFVDPRKEEGELLWPERFSRRYLEEDLKPMFRKQGGTYAESGQLQQRPAPRGGGMFQKDDFQFIDEVPEGAVCKGRVRGWDLAGSKRLDSPYTVGLLLGIYKIGVAYRLVIEDVARARATPHEVEELILRCARQDGYSVAISIPQDPGQSGKAQKSSYAALLSGYNVSFSLESGAKETRAKPASAQSEAGNLFLIRAKWNAPFIAEATGFPAGKYKDQIDALSRAYAHMLSRPKKKVATQSSLILGDEV